MKYFILSVLALYSFISRGQIYSRSITNGSISITPNGLVSGNSDPNSSISNISLGGNAFVSNTTGTGNVAIGFYALSSSIIGEGNVAIGQHALKDNLTGDDNAAHGFHALRLNTHGSGNCANGTYSLSHNTLGGYNTASGTYSLPYNTLGWYNTSNGALSLLLNSTGYGNTASGYGALSRNTTGFKNTALGDSTGLSNSTGSNNTFIGFLANSDGNNYTNATALGAKSIVNASNKIRLGNTQVTVIEGQVAYSYPSDRRLKENILYTSRLGLDFITKLQTVSYSYKSDNTHVRHDGFIAQDIEAVMKELNVPFSGLKKSDDGMYSLAYSDFVMPLVNAAKELKQQNDEQQSEINDLKKQLAALAQRMTEMETAKTEAKMNDSEAAKR